MEESVDEKEALPEPENKARSFADRLPNLKAYRNQVLIRRLALIIGLLMIPLLIVLYFVSPLAVWRMWSSKAIMKYPQKQFSKIRPNRQ